MHAEREREVLNDWTTGQTIFSLGSYFFQFKAKLKLVNFAFRLRMRANYRVITYTLSLGCLRIINLLRSSLASRMLTSQ